MKEVNSQIANEYLTLNKFYWDAFFKANTDEKNLGSITYKWYNQNNSEMLRSMLGDYSKILGIEESLTDEEFRKICTELSLSKEQLLALKNIRKHPMFKMVMGEKALEQKAELEQLLNSKISFKNREALSEDGVVVTVKSEEELEKELNKFNDTLDSLYNLQKINEEQYHNYQQQIDYIFNYYISLSHGEQIPFRPISDQDVTLMQKQAHEEGIDFNTVLNNLNKEKVAQFLEIQQQLREDGPKR